MTEREKIKDLLRGMSIDCEADVEYVTDQLLKNGIGLKSDKVYLVVVDKDHEPLYFRAASTNKNLASAYIRKLKETGQYSGEEIWEYEDGFIVEEINQISRNK